MIILNFQSYLFRCFQLEKAFKINISFKIGDWIEVGKWAKKYKKLLSKGGKKGREVMEKYELFGFFGNRSQAEPFHARNRYTGDTVIIRKYILIPSAASSCSPVVSEITALSSLRHPNILKLVEVIINKIRARHFEVFVIYDSIDCDLSNYMLNRLPGTKVLDATRVRKLLYMCLKGLAYCHDKGYIHGNINPMSLLVNKKGNQLRICSFERSKISIGAVERRENEESHNFLPYRAPELLLRKHVYTSAVDIWSAGCVFAEMLTSKVIFSGHDDNEVLSGILSVFGPFELSELVGCSLSTLPIHPSHFEATGRLEYFYPVLKVVGKHGLALLHRLLERNPSKRISAAAALRSKYFQR